MDVFISYTVGLYNVMKYSSPEVALKSEVRTVDVVSVHR